MLVVPVLQLLLQFLLVLPLLSQVGKSESLLGLLLLSLILVEVMAPEYPARVAESET